MRHGGGATCRTRGFGFITFDDAASAELALSNRYHQIADQNVEVKMAIPRTPDPQPVRQAATESPAPNGSLKESQLPPPSHLQEIRPAARAAAAAAPRPSRSHQQAAGHHAQRMHHQRDQRGRGVGEAPMPYTEGGWWHGAGAEAPMHYSNGAWRYSTGTPAVHYSRQQAPHAPLPAMGPSWSVGMGLSSAGYPSHFNYHGHPMAVPAISAMAYPAMGVMAPAMMPGMMLQSGMPHGAMLHLPPGGAPPGVPPHMQHAAQHHQQPGVPLTGPAPPGWASPSDSPARQRPHHRATPAAPTWPSQNGAPPAPPARYPQPFPGDDRQARAEMSTGSRPMASQPFASYSPLSDGGHRASADHSAVHPTVGHPSPQLPTPPSPLAIRPTGAPQQPGASAAVAFGGVHLANTSQAVGQRDVKPSWVAHGGTASHSCDAACVAAATAASTAATAAATATLATSQANGRSEPKQVALSTLDSPKLSDLPPEIMLEIASRAPLHTFRRVVRFDVVLASCMRIQRCYRHLVREMHASRRLWGGSELAVGDRVFVRRPGRFATAAACIGPAMWRLQLLSGTFNGGYLDVPTKLIRQLQPWSDGPWANSVGRNAALASASASRGAAMQAASAAVAAALSANSSPAQTALAVAAASAASQAAAAATAASAAAVAATESDVGAAEASEAAQLSEVAQMMHDALNTVAQGSGTGQGSAEADTLAHSGDVMLAMAVSAATMAATAASAATSAAEAVDAVGTLAVTTGTAVAAASAAENVATAAEMLSTAAPSAANEAAAAEVAATAVVEMGVAGRALARSCASSETSSEVTPTLAIADADFSPMQVIADAHDVAAEAAEAASAATSAQGPMLQDGHRDADAKWC